MTTLWWVNLTFACCGVETNSDNIITHTAPILYKFRGQHLSNLERWNQVIEIRKVRSYAG